MAIVVICILLAGWAAEVRPLTLYEKIGNFSSYINSIFKLDNGARVWTDPVEWFWGLGKWLRLLGETLLIGLCRHALAGAGDRLRVLFLRLS